MPRFLSEEYFEAAAQRVATHAPLAAAAENVDLTVQFVVTDAPGGDVQYGLVIARGHVRIVEGVVADADLTVMNDYETAVGISSGRINTQSAFITGRLTVDGDMAAIIRHQAVIEQFAAAMGGLDIEY